LVTKLTAGRNPPPRQVVLSSIANMALRHLADNRYFA
jgi:hypothetical protein